MKSNTRLKNNKRGIECLNCKQPLNSQDRFCSNCGQVNDLKPLSIKQFLKELLSGFFAFDTRTFNTLKPLLFKPGKVTKDYISGHRVKYVNPFQLYLHTTIIFFLVSSLLSALDNYTTHSYTSETSYTSKDNSKSLDINASYGSGVHISYDTKKTASEKREIITGERLKAIIAENATNFAKDTTFTSLMQAKPIPKDSLKIVVANHIDSAFVQLRRKYQLKKGLSRYWRESKFEKVYLKDFRVALQKEHYSYQLVDSLMKPDYSKLSPLMKKIKQFSNSENDDAASALDSLGYKKTFWNLWLFNKSKRVMKTLDGDTDGSWFMANFKSNISLVLFLILPLFAFFLYATFSKNKLTYTEHLIFVFNVQTVFFIILLVFSILEYIIDVPPFTTMLISLPLFAIYLYIALLRFYDRSKWRTFFYFILLNTTFFILSFLGLFAVLFLSILF